MGNHESPHAVGAGGLPSESALPAGTRDPKPPDPADQIEDASAECRVLWHSPTSIVGVSTLGLVFLIAVGCIAVATLDDVLLCVLLAGAAVLLWAVPLLWLISRRAPRPGAGPIVRFQGAVVFCLVVGCTLAGAAAAVKSKSDGSTFMYIVQFALALSLFPLLPIIGYLALRPLWRRMLRDFADVAQESANARSGKG
ncbi:MAG: hypothetical protein IPM64_01890 [Phycisphaerales bacterium]|nr:hypothetical protein [Phycisphaerales bacterium]